MTRAIPTADQLPAAVREGLEGLAADAIGPFGRTPLAQLVADHLSVFAELRRLDGSWAQIAGLLAAHGIEGTDGPVTADVLRATYARAAAAVAANGVAVRNRTKRNETDRNEEQRDEAQRREAKRDETKRGGAKLPETSAEKAGRDAPSRNGTNATPTGQNSRPDRSTTAADSLARRAALIHKPLNTR